LEGWFACPGDGSTSTDEEPQSSRKTPVVFHTARCRDRQTGASAQGREAETVDVAARLKAAWSEADVQLTSSRF